MYVASVVVLLYCTSQVLGGLQSANSQKRHVGQHVEYESRAWQYAFILEFEVMGVLKPVLRAFGDRGAPREMARPLQLRCAELLQRWARSSARQAGETCDAPALLNHRVFLGETCLRRFILTEI